jgi:hypothetical protein
MSRPVYKIEEGSLHERFQNSRAKIQMFGGGFGNGKTTAAIIKALKLSRDYPGSNGLIARATFPKLNSTIRKEFVRWCPPSWVKRDVNSKENLIELTNGTIINFSYIAQGGKQNESSTSNLLSATYDWIVVDQVEDPEITEKDFLDLLGRLRGNTTYQAEDETMPSTGPRWLILMCNPTRNWVYRKLVKPLQDYAIGIKNPELLWDVERDCPLVELFEGSTYENAANLPADFIATQEAAYKGQMRERFLEGKWGAYEGLIYPQYDTSVHMVNRQRMLDYFSTLCLTHDPTIVEAYDHGIASPACYGFAFTDPQGNVHLLDGFYEKEQTIQQLARRIKQIRTTYGHAVDEDDDLAVTQRILADPAIFRRASGGSRTVGTTTSGLFKEEGIRMQRANNDIINGIAKVQSYLAIDEMHTNPYDGTPGSPRFFVSADLSWFDREIVDYYWKRDTSGEYEDVPTDRNDHSMDMTKYLLTNRPRIATFIVRRPSVPAKYMRWRESETINAQVKRNPRYA